TPRPRTRARPSARRVVAGCASGDPLGQDCSHRGSGARRAHRASGPVSMIGPTHGVRSNTLPPSAALLALGVWQCGAMLLLEETANWWLTRPAAWLGVVIANSVVMTVYLWNMSAVVLAAVLLFPTRLAPQPEPLTPAWWWLRPAWIVACAICLVPFVLAFRWAERPAKALVVGPVGVTGAVI